MIITKSTPFTLAEIKKQYLKLTKYFFQKIL